ncbi:CLUMA_CG000257, isoform A [Clunio marinus]|uniref:CLUMA_CG000257, isoform A n=1 Tax=Clunio marinus TaxID=568069 RepID=A0A1J1HG68_9DIPT|nr:CLUMA_CG000257, isoform A [Clunio marinus]
MKHDNIDLNVARLLEKGLAEGLCGVETVFNVIEYSTIQHARATYLKQYRGMRCGWSCFRVVFEFSYLKPCRVRDEIKFHSTLGCREDSECCRFLDRKSLRLPTLIYVDEVCVFTFDMNGAVDDI